MKKMNRIAAVTTAAALLITNTVTAAAGNTSTYSYFGSLSEICEPEDSNADSGQTQETPASTLKPEAETNTSHHQNILPQMPEEKPAPETTTRETQRPTEETTVKFPFFEPTTREYTTETTTRTIIEPSTETTTKAVIEASTETTTKAAETTTKPAQTTTEATTAKPTQTTTETTTVKPTQTTTETQTETTTAAQTSGSTSNSSAAQQILNLVNEERAAAGLSALTLDSSLTNAAQLKAQDMADNNYFSHTSPTYGTPFQMLSSLGISYKSAGENIAKGQKSAEAVMTAWMNSSGHKANILSSSYGKLGVGYVNQNGTTYWVQIFTD